MQSQDDLDSKESLLRMEIVVRHNDSYRSTLMQRDAGADPRFVDVEINAHHFALAHPDEIVHESRIAIILRPNKHHSDFSF